MTTLRRGIAMTVLTAAVATGTTGMAAGPAAAAPKTTAVGASVVPSAVVIAAKSKKKSSSLDKRCRTGRVVCIDKSTRKLRWVVDGKVKMELSARFGSSRTPTHSGSFKILWKDIDHVSSIFESSMPFSMFFSGGQAVHYSSDFAARGYNGASHGCVNVKNWSKVKELFAKTRVGDKVIVYSS